MQKMVYYANTHTVHWDMLNGFATKHERDEYCKCVEATCPVTAAEVIKLFGIEEYKKCKGGRAICLILGDGNTNN